jgi:hypothetical protein
LEEEFAVCCCEGTDKVILERLNGAFGRVNLMVVRLNEHEFTIFAGEEFLNLLGPLIVHHVQLYLDTFAFQKFELCYIHRKNSVVIETGYSETKDRVGFVVVYDEVAHISLQGHVWERPDPVRSLYKTHVRLSANAVKQKKNPTELSSSLMMIKEPCSSGPAWNNGTEILSIQLSLSAIGVACTVGPGLADGGCRGCCVVVL